MTPELEAARSSRIVIVSVVSAAVAITLLCIVGIAAILGLVGPRSEEPPAVAAVKLAQKTARAAPPAVALVPGETLVAPPDAPPPSPAPGKAPPPAVAPEAPASTEAPAKPAESRPARAPRKPAPSSRTAPSTPSYARAETHPTDPGEPRPRRMVCRTCGTVTAIATFPDLWEVRVRLEDGATFNVRYPNAPGLRVGDRVRLADGRLVRE